MARERRNVVTQTADFNVVDSDDDTLFLIGAADKVATLPAVSIANKGMRVHFAMLAAGLSGGTGFSISPNAADGIRGKVNATGAALSGADDKDIVNTGATDVAGDSVTLVSDGVDGWQAIAVQGTWASES